MAASRRTGHVFAGKTGDCALSTLALTGIAVLADQPGDLLAGIAADLHQIVDQDTFILFAQFSIVKFVQGSLDPAVAVILIEDDGEGYSLSSRKKFR
jgi:hypothetical protein